MAGPQAISLTFATISASRQKRGPLDLAQRHCPLQTWSQDLPVGGTKTCPWALANRQAGHWALTLHGRHVV